MYARSTTVRADPSRVDAGIAEVRDGVMPLVQGMDGFVGLSMLADRATGRCIVTTAWETEEAMRASAERVRDSRAQAARTMGAGEPEVAEWEIAVLHRVHEAPAGACTRVAWGRTDPARMADMLEAYRSRLVPRLEDMPGFCSVSLLADRRSGLGASAVTFESRESLDRSRERGQQLGNEFTRSMGVEITEVAEFELVLAHLRVPEMV